MSQPWVVMMPDNWDPEDCTTCGNYRHFCRERFRDDMECPYANAKKAVEINTFRTQEGHAYTGRPAVVYAVEAEK